MIFQLLNSYIGCNIIFLMIHVKLYFGFLFRKTVLFLLFFDTKISHNLESVFHKFRDTAELITDKQTVSIQI